MSFFIIFYQALIIKSPAVECKVNGGTVLFVELILIKIHSAYDSFVRANMSRISFLDKLIGMVVRVRFNRRII